MEMSISVHIMYQFVTALAQKVIWLPPFFICFWYLGGHILKKNEKCKIHPIERKFFETCYIGEIRHLI